MKNRRTQGDSPEKQSPVEGWTAGRFQSFITTTLRSGFIRYPNKFKVLKKAELGRKINPKTKRLAMMYRCASCKKPFPNKEVQVDHIKPIVGPTGFSSWDDFIHNLFCEESNLQVLCVDCHKEKTQKERSKRNATHKKVLSSSKKKTG